MLRPSTTVRGGSRTPEGRGREVSRLEGFTDAVLGFALTLLVVSLEVPETFDDLWRVLAGFPAFAATFTLICWVWYEHYLLFRRYELKDGFSILLNCVLLFIVVFYAYPLKFLFTRLIGGMIGVGPVAFETVSAANGRLLMITYSAGFVALFATFMLLHWNALRQRVALGLDALEAYDARSSIRRHALSVSIGLASVAIAWLGPPQYIAFSGMIFFLMGPAHAAYGYWNGLARERFEAATRELEDADVLESIDA